MTSSPAGRYNQAMVSLIMKLPRAVRAIFFYLLQATWCLPQNIVGAFARIFLRGRSFRYHGSLVTIYRCSERTANRIGAFSLSCFIFIPEAWDEEYRRRVVVHEYGHVVQSLMLGPFYLAAVGLPSVIWANRYQKRFTRYASRGVRYTDRFPENEADRLGEKVTGEKA